MQRDRKCIGIRMLGLELADRWLRERPKRRFIIVKENIRLVGWRKADAEDMGLYCTGN